MLKEKEKLTIFGKKDSLNKLNEFFNDYFFIDVTFKLIDQSFRSNKILTITAVKNGTKITKFACLIALVYMDEKIYKQTFRYLYENYDFAPRIVHIDYAAFFI